MTQLNAQEIIALSHEITPQNKSYNDQKSALNKNSDADGIDGLITYNKMLDHLAFGAHTFYEFEYLGNKWTMRLLGNKEDIDINKSVTLYATLHALDLEVLAGILHHYKKESEDNKDSKYSILAHGDSMYHKSGKKELFIKLASAARK